MRAFLAILLTALSAQNAVAQIPDKLCEGLGAIIKAASEAPPFQELKKSWSTGKPYAGVASRAGLEDAFSCTASPAGGKFEIFECQWMTAAAQAARHLGPSKAERVAACLAPAGWTSQIVMEDADNRVHRFAPPQGDIDVIVLFNTSGKVAQRDSIMVRVKNP